MKFSVLKITGMTGLARKGKTAVQIRSMVPNGSWYSTTRYERNRLEQPWLFCSKQKLIEGILQHHIDVVVLNANILTH